jgi:hypothetical protein
LQFDILQFGSGWQGPQFDQLRPRSRSLRAGIVPDVEAFGRDE